MSMRILLTGGCGFIGSNFVRFVLRERPEYTLINLDCLSYAGNLANLDGLDDGGRYRFVRGNVCDRKLVGSLVAECDAVVHMAAQSHVDRSISDSYPFIETNVCGTQTLLDSVKRVSSAGGTGTHAHPVRFLHVSTDEVYGSLPLDRPDLRFTEQSPVCPRSPYAASKAAADHLVDSYHRTFGLDTLITRCSNNLGPFQYPEKVIPLFVTNLIEGKKVPLYGDGQNVRDWLHVDDHCEAVLTVLEKGQSGETYNVGGDNEQSNLALTKTILRLMNQSETMIEHVADRLGHDRRYAIDATKLRDELGWSPTRSSWPAALESTVRWYIDNPCWWRPLKHGTSAARKGRRAAPPSTRRSPVAVPP